MQLDVGPREICQTFCTPLCVYVCVYVNVCMCA